MLCHRQGLKNKNKNTNTNIKTNKYDKYKNNRQTYVVICFWKGDDKRSLICRISRICRICKIRKICKKGKIFKKCRISNINDQLADLSSPIWSSFSCHVLLKSSNIFSSNEHILKTISFHQFLSSI